RKSPFAAHRRKIGENLVGCRFALAEKRTLRERLLSLTQRRNWRRIASKKSANSVATSRVSRIARPRPLGYVGRYSEIFWNDAVSMVVNALLPNSLSSAQILSSCGLREGQTER